MPNYVQPKAWISCTSCYNRKGAFWQANSFSRLTIEQVNLFGATKSIGRSQHPVSGVNSGAYIADIGRFASRFAASQRRGDPSCPGQWAPRRVTNSASRAPARQSIILGARAVHPAAKTPSRPVNRPSIRDNSCSTRFGQATGIRPTLVVQSRGLRTKRAMSVTPFTKANHGTAAIHLISRLPRIPRRRDDGARRRIPR